MKKILFCVLLSQTLFSQVGIGNTSPKGALDLRGTATQNMGLVLPETSNIANMKTPDGTPVLEGTLIWDNQEKCMKFSTSTAWSKCIPTKDDITGGGTGGSPADIKSLLAGGRTPIKVKRDSKGFPLYTTSPTNITYVNNVNSNMYGAGNNNNSYPPLTNLVGANLNPAFVSTLKFVSQSIGGYANNGDNYLFSVGVTDAGLVYTAGGNAYGQLGSTNPSHLTYINVTSAIEGLAPNEKIIKVVASTSNVALLSNQGNIYTAGYSYYGANGNGTSYDTSAPTNQSTYKKVLFRTDDGTTNADKFITNIFVSSTQAENFSAISSTNKLFAWGPVLGSGLITNKPNDASGTGGDGNFGSAFSTVGYDSKYTRYATNVTRTFDTTDQILVGSTIRKFIVGDGNSYLLLEDGRLFGVGYTCGTSDPYPGYTYTSTYSTTPKLVNAILYPAANYQNTSTLADQHKIVDFSYSTKFGVSSGSYSGTTVNSGGFFYPDGTNSNGGALIMAITKKDLWMKGYQYIDAGWGSRLANNFTGDYLNWTQYDTSTTEFGDDELVGVDAGLLRSTVAVKSPTETASDGVRLYNAGYGAGGQGGSYLKENNGIAMIFKPLTY